MFFVLVEWILDRHSLGLAWDAYIFSRGFFTGWLPLLAVYGIWISITNRTGLSLLLSIAGVIGLFVANAKKVEYLHTTVVPADYSFVKGLDASSIELFRYYVDLPIVVGAIVVVAVVTGILLRYEPPTFRNHMIVRIVVLFLSITLGAMLLSSTRTLESIYNKQALGISYSPLVSQLHAGLVSSLVSANIANQRALDVVADAAAVERVVAEERAQFPEHGATAPTGAEAIKPDIVVVQSESFFDPSIMQGIETEELLPNLRRAQKESGVRVMSVPTFGGGTLRTEFEVLTGIPLEAYPDLLFPYLQISQPRISSVVTALGDAGYSTTAIHPNSGEFWNRRAAFQSIGFQRFVTVKDFPTSAYRDGHYMSDHSMTSQIIESLEGKQGPSFIFAISIEAHGPYRHVAVNDVAERNALPVPASWSAKAADEFRTYSYHIRHADSELGRLWNYLKGRNRPFVLVFYGDHLPGFEFVYQASKFRNELPAYEQRVPWVVVDNTDSSPERLPGHMYSWMLADEILRRAGLHEPTYLRFAGNVGRMLDAEGGVEAGQTRAGLQSAARMRLTGRFDAFYRSRVGAD